MPILDLDERFNNNCRWASWIFPGVILYKHTVLNEYCLKLNYFSIRSILCSFSLSDSRSFFPLYFSRLKRQKYLETAWCAAFFSTWRSPSPGRKRGVWSPNKTHSCCTCTVRPRYVNRVPLWDRGHRDRGRWGDAELTILLSLLDRTRELSFTVSL